MKAHQDLTPIQLPVRNGSLNTRGKGIRRLFNVSIANVGIARSIVSKLSVYETERILSSHIFCVL